MNTICQPEFLDQIEDIPPLPAIVMRVLAVTGSSRSSAEDVARVLRDDQVIAAQILRVANSPFYGASRQISELSRAVTRLGTTAVRNLVLGICVRNTLSVDPRQATEHEMLWKHATAVAAACELIARRIRFWPAEEAFVAGLLHDAGQLAMLMLQPDRFRSVLKESIAIPSPLDHERTQFGIDHAEVGFRILTRWQLPDKLCQVVQHHHAPDVDLASSRDPLLAIVVFADTLAHLVCFGPDKSVGSLTRVEIATQQLQLSPADQEEVFGHLRCRVEKAIEMLGDMHVSSTKPRRLKTSQSVLWICDSDSTPPRILIALLEHCGYKVRLVHPSDVDVDASPSNLILTVSTSSEGDTFPQLALNLMRQGCCRIAVMKEPDKGNPSRDRNAETGICRIPRLFTASDIKWLEEQMEL